MKRYISFFILFMCLVPLSGIAKTSTINVKRDRALLRKGPGSFYEVLAAVPKGTVLGVVEDLNGWIKVGFQEKTGFISEKVTKEATSQKDVFSCAKLWKR